MAKKKSTDPGAAAHFSGRVPATTALRTLLAHAGVVEPNTKRPFTEAMLFGIAGGVGIGAVSFHYAMGNFSSTYLAGRHLWFDDLEYLQKAIARLGLQAIVKESSGAKSAEKQLRVMLAAGPCIAWVDKAHLPHRGLPAIWSGGGYHVVTVYMIEDDHALIGDLADEPVTIALADLAAARARIAKQKNRLLSISNSSSPKDLEPLVQDGLNACRAALSLKGGKGPLAMSTFDALERWADRLHGSKDKESWDNIFPPGINLWRGLTSIYQFIEIYDNGGGLYRPLMAEFLAEAAKLLKDPPLKDLSKQYATLGKAWTGLANAALPESVPLFKEARQQYGKLRDGSAGKKKAVWARLDELGAQAKQAFPLDDQQCAELRTDLQKRVRQIVADERAAIEAMSW